MRIIGLIKKDSGVDFHRILLPLLLMEGVDSYITNNIKEEDFENCSAVYYNRIVNEDLVKLCRKKGIKIVLDIDDYWVLDQHHIAYDDYIENEFEKLQCKHLWFADEVTTTHERLAEKIYPYNKNVVICPNAIPEHEYFPVEKTQSERTRVFWQGSITHEHDIKLLRNPIKRLDKNKFLMVLAGYTEHEVWGRMAGYFTNGLNLNGCILKGSSPFEYYQNYKYADVAVIPLLESKFNSYKSNLKVLEAGHSGVPAVVSNVHPYKDLPVLYVNKQSDWINHLQALRDDKVREELGGELRKFCKENYDFQTINNKRKECFCG